MANSNPHLRDSRQRAASRVADRAATTLLRAMEYGIPLQTAFVLDEEDLETRRCLLPAANAPKSIGSRRIAVDHNWTEVLEFLEDVA